MTACQTGPAFLVAASPMLYDLIDWRRGGDRGCRQASKSCKGFWPGKSLRKARSELQGQKRIRNATLGSYMPARPFFAAQTIRQHARL
jgi:hypothetical protein